MSSRAMSASAYQWSVVGVCTKQSVLGQCIAGVAGDGIDGSLVRLVLDRLEQHEQRPGDVRSQVVVHRQRQPVRQQLLDDKLCPTSHDMQSMPSRRSLALSRTISEIWPVIGSKSQNFPTPSHLGPSIGVTPMEFWEKR